MSNIANLRSWTNGLDLDLEEKNLFERWILNASDVNLFLPFLHSHFNISAHSQILAIYPGR